MGASACALLVQSLEKFNHTLLHVDLGGNGANFSALEILDRTCWRNRAERHAHLAKAHQRPEHELHKEEQQKRMELQRYVLQLEKEMAIRQEHFTQVIEEMHTEAGETSRQLSEARDEVRELKEHLRTHSFDLAAEKKKSMEASRLKNEVLDLQKLLSTNEKDRRDLQSRVQQLEMERDLQEEKLQSLELQKESAADSSLLLQQSLDDSTIANKQLESVIHQRDQELENQNKKILQLRQQLSSVSLASETQQNLLLSQSQDLQKRLQEVEEEILRVNIEKQLLEKKYEQCSWRLEQEEVQNKQLKKRQDDKLQEEKRILHEKAEEWKK
ncbi:myosin heavy chain, partial [Cystoisospora suis]